jgi:hypothetical protein
LYKQRERTALTPRSKNPRIPGQTFPCGWCGRPVALRTTGRIPKWCSDGCRHRAWEQRRALGSGRGSVEVVDRVMDVEKRVRVVERVEVPARPRRYEWAGLLVELAKQIDSGRVHDRHLPDIAVAIDEILRSLARRNTRRTGRI